MDSPEDDFVTTNNTDNNATLASDEKKAIKFIIQAVFSWKAYFCLTDNVLAFIISSIFVCLQYLSNICSSNKLERIVASFPKTLYLARQMLRLNDDDFINYVTCPKCYSLHNYNDCTGKKNGI